jgi:lipocalin
MYEQGKTTTFDADKFFSGFWYHIVTNVRPSTSLWKKIQGKPMACHNVIIEYKKIGDVMTYANACYIDGNLNQNESRKGTLTPVEGKVGVFNMIDGESKTSRIFNVLATDYTNYAIVTNGSTAFWVLSRTPTICGNTLGLVLAKLKELKFDVSNTTVDFQTVQECKK